MTMHLKQQPGRFLVEAVGITEGGRVCKGQQLVDTCGSIDWGRQNSPLSGHEVIMPLTQPPELPHQPWFAAVTMGPGSGVGQVTATCHNMPAIGRENNIGRLLVDPPRVMDTFGNNWASLFDQPPEDAPPPPKSSGGMGAGGVLLIGAAVAAAAVGIAVAAGGMKGSSSSSSDGSSGVCVSSESCIPSVFSGCTASSCSGHRSNGQCGWTGPVVCTNGAACPAGSACCSGLIWVNGRCESPGSAGAHNCPAL